MSRRNRPEEKRSRREARTKERRMVAARAILRHAGITEQDVEAALQRVTSSHEKAQSPDA